MMVAEMHWSIHMMMAHIENEYFYHTMTETLGDAQMNPTLFQNGEDNEQVLWRRLILDQKQDVSIEGISSWMTI